MNYPTHLPYDRSGYADSADYIKELTGLDCTTLNAAQMDEVGMAVERAQLAWDWSLGESEGCEDRAKKIAAAKCEVKSVFDYSDETQEVINY